MSEQIATVLAEFGQSFGDTRTQLCQVAAAILDDEHCVLSGSVLDRETLDSVVTTLRDRLPGLTFDASSVEVLRRPGAIRLAVATNLTGLYAKPSFLAEMLSELLHGWEVEVLREQERWCFVRQADGYLGWAYRPYLTPEPTVSPPPTHIVCEPVSLLRRDPVPDAALVTRLLGGTQLSVQESIPGWAKLSPMGGCEAWTPAANLRLLRILPSDEAGRRAQIAVDALRFVGVPYLWGGCSALGIDCSGFVRLLHQLIGLSLPRDADMQFNAAAPVAFPYQPGDLLFFGENGRSASPKITHVALSLGGWRVIHSSRSRNGVYEDDVQAVAHLHESFVATRTFIGR
ncbi:MAG: C40 family peptidase [Anaerolineae bacterium]|jgi:cell wall-associated NlpC family hydrolase|nr:C40 family peptidase [Anaerolineae bacterium]